MIQVRTYGIRAHKERRMRKPDNAQTALEITRCSFCDIILLCYDTGTVLISYEITNHAKKLLRT